MTYAQTHAELWYSPKFTRLSFAARGLWVTCQSWCAGQLTDGLIPDKDVKNIGGSHAQIRALIKAGLWEVDETEDGERAYQFHDWLDHNESAIKVSTRKRKEKERKAAQRAKKFAQDPTETSGESDPNLTQTSGTFDRGLTQTSGKFGGSSRDGTPSDLRGWEAVPGGNERKENRTGTKHNSPTGSVSARPTGEAHTRGTETETKAETKAKDEEPKSPPNLSDPRFSPNSLSSRFSALREGSAVVDVSSREDQGPAPSLETPEQRRHRQALLPNNYNYAPFTNPSGGAGNTSARQPGGQGGSSMDNRELTIGKTLEQMSPSDLLRYIVLSQDELNGIKLSGSGPKGVATMSKFQESYGPEKAAAIMRHLFVKERGKCEVGRNGVEHITQDHFIEPLWWFTDRVDVKAQVKSSYKRSAETDFIFATEL